MKEILPICIIGVLLLSGFGAVALNSDVEKLDSETIDYETSSNGILDFTHTVLAEYGTVSYCPPCAPVNGYMYSIYNSGNYDFYYVTLNTDHETLAKSRYWELPAAQYVPTVWFDGGYSYLIGNKGSTTPYENKITTSGSRSVADIDLDVVVNWLGDAEMSVTVSLTNNDGSSYNGHLHAYITEITSRWEDYSGKPYHFSMIGYAFNQNINIEAGDTWSDTVYWDGDSHGYGDVTEDNIMVIATVFDSSTKHVDETDAATPNGNRPPNTPRPPSGPTSGTVGVEYTYTSSTTDPDGDDIFYLFDWDDGTDSGWLGPHNSGDTVEASHTWIEEGIYDLKVKAKDVHDAESSWSDPLTVYIGDMPVIKIGNITGGLFKVSAVIRNIGSADATRVNWSIILDGGIILLGKETFGRITSIPAGDEKTIGSILIFGFGKTAVTVTAEIPESSDTKEHDAFVLLFFIKVNPDSRA